MTDDGRELRVQRNVMIPLRDGVRVAADLVLPARDEPAPAVFTYYPYRKDDYIGVFEADTLRYFAERGYASLIVDFRGLGGSEGTPHEAMDAAGEGEDGADIVAWVAEQPWCDGNVGRWGHSW